jgi:hypothetical protein
VDSENERHNTLHLDFWEQIKIEKQVLGRTNLSGKLLLALARTIIFGFWHCTLIVYSLPQKRVCRFVA